MIVSYFVLYSEDWSVTAVFKWVLLAAAKKELNTEKHSLSCAVTILGQALKETFLTSYVYSCICEICGSLSQRASWHMYIFMYLYHKGYPGVTQRYRGLAWVSCFSIQTLHQCLLPFQEKFSPTESYLGYSGENVSLGPPSVSHCHGDPILISKWNMKPPTAGWNTHCLPIKWLWLVFFLTHKDPVPLMWPFSNVFFFPPSVLNLS